MAAVVHSHSHFICDHQITRQQPARRAATASPSRQPVDKQSIKCSTFVLAGYCTVAFFQEFEFCYTGVSVGRSCNRGGGLAAAGVGLLCYGVSLVEFFTLVKLMKANVSNGD